MGAIAAVLVAVGAVVVTPLVLTRLGLAAMTETIVSWARWPALMLGLLLGLAVLYRYGPSRRAAKWEWLSIGGIFAALAWFAVSAGLSYYFANFANYNATYGSLGAAIGTMIWIWLSTIVVLLGAELNSEIEYQTARDTTVGPEKALGARGATMADTVSAPAPGCAKHERKAACRDGNQKSRPSNIKRPSKPCRPVRKTSAEIARLFKIHPGTVSRIVSQARAGVSDGLTSLA